MVEADDADGKLPDVGGVIADGKHHGTFCGSCRTELSSYEVR
jgi:hypothetical protein